jgi:proteasome lid subunit RPN8/RPN11
VGAGRGRWRLPRTVRRAVTRHAREAAPAECCGLLVGRGRAIARAVPTRNRATGLSRFEVDPHDHIAIRRALRATPSLQIVGVYHSHPAGPAHPSAADVEGAHYPEWVHLIASRTGRRWEVRAFRIRDGRATPVATTERRATLGR